MKVRIIVNSWVDDRTEEERDIPLFVKGHPETSEVWRGDMEILNENTYLLRLSVLAEGEPQPICDVPFSLGSGYYMWVPPEGGLEYDSESFGSGRNMDDSSSVPGLFRDISKSPLPRMEIAGRKRVSRFRIPFRDFWRFRSHANLDSPR